VPVNNAGSTVTTSAATGAVVITVVGAAGFLVLPVLLGAAVIDLALTQEQVGLLGSFVLAGSAFSALSAALLVRTLPWRPLAVAALSVEVAGFATATLFDSYEAVRIPIFLASLGGGAAYSLALTVLSDHLRSARMFGYSLTAQVAFQVVGLLTLPVFAVPGGFDISLFVLAGIAASGLLVVGFLPSRGNDSRSETQLTMKEIVGQPVAVLALLGCFVFFVNIGSIWAYVERIGSLAGFTPTSLGQALAAGVAVGMAGSLSAAWIGDRFGYVLPLTIAALGTVVAVAVLIPPLSVTEFVAAFAVYNFVWNYSLAYQYATVAQADSSGRYVAAAPAFHALGGAVGPAVAAAFVTTADLLAVNIVAASAALLSLAALIPAARMQFTARAK